MNNKLKNKHALIIPLLVITSAILISSFAASSGVTSPYWDTNPLVMNPGQTQDIQFGLQNLVGDQNITFKATVSEGSDIAKIIDSNAEYFVPLGRKDVYVNVRVSIPNSAKPGDKYKVTLSFSGASNTKGGQLTFGSAFDNSFDVLVQDKSVTGNSTSSGASGSKTFVYVLVILILIVIAVIFFKKSKNKN